MAHQQERFESFLKKEISEFLQRNTWRGEGVFISVTKVVSGERSDNARVLVTIFPEDKAEETFKQIKRMEKETRRFVASRSRRRFIPQIKFVLYGGGKEMELEKLLEKVKNE
ncbi:hypothetical protein A3I36_04685 [Candidatus Giovannonibacteria bacterium RIFCSPLOWO2_02_FULL_45_28]|uniref:Ribosome-binding factor A n=2 Tax=Candidatus Giovannoniibacteriota TaxID=1752738 RepID=A0A1F5WB92_9BACT|nr:MAG: Ribosome-binding factor A [Parcubacteria group bacterium GW2011_GWC1_44_10]KKT59413.1 MAG: Ribosome-binding factor A [Candidatus Giovannonibacteria bacterium GW2011_GWA1_44_25]KKU29530.1 MAG: Ribosome-binding factor A [Candidatus Giovannonibacteria bacterium GW2011_GWB1_46_20]OGF49109.1 MAG: hypothetical protein A2120_04810 [Candidatus Giovannonibacteria bacterium GWA2_45_15]OGF60547.1 MAG: hypothetical protein A2W40_02930 [Candidatus Giovannonibacteria bacterium RIFCSPHIGHO2_01_45_12]